MSMEFSVGVRGTRQGEPRRARHRARGEQVQNGPAVGGQRDGWKKPPGGTGPF